MHAIKTGTTNMSHPKTASKNCPNYSEIVKHHCFHLSENIIYSHINLLNIFLLLLKTEVNLRTAAQIPKEEARGLSSSHSQFQISYTNF